MDKHDMTRPYAIVIHSRRLDTPAVVVNTYMSKEHAYRAMKNLWKYSRKPIELSIDKNGNCWRAENSFRDEYALIHETSSVIEMFTNA